MDFNWTTEAMMNIGTGTSALLRLARVFKCAGVVLCVGTVVAHARQPAKISSDLREYEDVASTSQPAEADGIALWLKGQRDAAVEAFIQSDWLNGGFIAQDPTLGLTETQYDAKRSDDPAIENELLDKVKALKQLVVEVLRRSENAKNAGDAETARHDILAVKGCGIYLTSREDGLAILKLVGKTVLKIANDRLAKLSAPSN